MPPRPGLRGPEKPAPAELEVLGTRTARTSVTQ
jgi:hypothetical protein